jgi:hypothetical protein
MEYCGALDFTVQARRMDEFLKVILNGEEPGRRDVFIDGAPIGVTGDTLKMRRGQYNVSLDGNDYRPASRDIDLANTTPVQPKVVSFDQP